MISLKGEESKSRHVEQTKSRQKDMKRRDLFPAKTVKEKGKKLMWVVVLGGDGYRRWFGRGQKGVRAE